MISSEKCFIAIAFEKADYGHESACAVGHVKVVNNKIVDRSHFLICLPCHKFIFTYLHGMSWNSFKTS